MKSALLLTLPALAAAGTMAAGSMSGAAPATVTKDSEFGITDFAAWAVKNNRRYRSKEETMYRGTVFRENAAIVAAHNARGASFTMALNRFADLSNEEFANRFARGRVAAQRTLRGSKMGVFTAPMKDVPAAWDWVSKGKVHSVTNQGDCGSCWAFSVVGAVESIVAITSGKMTSLSQQQIVDCDRADGNDGCNGGDQLPAFNWVAKNGGLCSEADYPYTGTDGKCKKCTPVPGTNIAGGKAVTPGSTAALQAAVYAQPVSLSVEADSSAWQFYSGGVLNSASCGINTDHAVLGVGYGTLNGVEYWNIQNSWGSDWGLNGYIYIARGTQFEPAGMCGVLQDNSVPIMG